MSGRFPLPPGTFARLELLTNDDGLLAILNLLASGSLGGVDMQRTRWVGKHGDDDNSGQTLETAFLTFTEALAAASSGDVVCCLDAGSYEEELSVPAGVHIWAPNATLTTAAGGAITNAALTLDADSDVMVRAIVPKGNRSAVIRANTAGTARIRAQVIDCRAGGGACLFNLSFAGGGILMSEVEQVHVGTGFGVGSITVSTGHTHVNIEDIYIHGNNGFGLAQFGGNGIVGRVTHILEFGSPTGTVAILVNGGRVDLMAGGISADTAWTVGGAGTLSLFYNQATGVQVETGTVLKSTPA